MRRPWWGFWWFCSFVAGGFMGHEVAEWFYHRGSVLATLVAVVAVTVAMSTPVILDTREPYD